MAKTRKEKEKIVEALRQSLKGAGCVLFTSYRGLSVSKINNLRRLLKEKGYQYKVVKKTLIERALGEEEAEALKVKEGEANGLVIGSDEIEPIKIVYNFIKENPELEVVKGLVGGEVLSEEEIKRLSFLPSRQTLLAQLVFTIKSPLLRLENSLQYNTRALLYVLSNIKK